MVSLTFVILPIRSLRHLVAVIAYRLISARTKTNTIKMYMQNSIFVAVQTYMIFFVALVEGFSYAIADLPTGNVGQACFYICSMNSSLMRQTLLMLPMIWIAVAPLIHAVQIFLLGTIVTCWQPDYNLLDADFLRWFLMASSQMTMLQQH